MNTDIVCLRCLRPVTAENKPAHPSLGLFGCASCLPDIARVAVWRADVAPRTYRGPIDHGEQ